MRRIAAVICVVLGLMAASAWVGAQSIAVQPVTPTVMAGQDIGFRVEGIRGDKAVGRFVIRVNGQWVEAEEISPAMIPRNR